MLSFHEFIIKLQIFWFQRHSNECPISYMIYKILNKIYKNIFTLFGNLKIYHHLYCIENTETLTCTITFYVFINKNTSFTYTCKFVKLILTFHMDTKTFVFYKIYIFFEEKSIYNYMQNENFKISHLLICEVLNNCMFLYV